MHKNKLAKWSIKFVLLARTYVHNHCVTCAGRWVLYIYIYIYIYTHSSTHTHTTHDSNRNNNHEHSCVFLWHTLNLHSANPVWLLRNTYFLFILPCALHVTSFYHSILFISLSSRLDRSTKATHETLRSAYLSLMRSPPDLLVSSWPPDTNTRYQVLPKLTSRLESIIWTMTDVLRITFSWTENFSRIHTYMHAYIRQMCYELHLHERRTSVAYTHTCIHMYVCMYVCMHDSVSMYACMRSMYACQ
jgi:hypothetical protein